ncbi:MAG: hypothetical protein GXP17_01795 [Gammaproteobacteria bacterium]|nr:hypothetical protein [Gammaproteobacteria bacterium]
MKPLILILLILGFSAAEAASPVSSLPSRQYLQKLLDDIKQAQQQKGEQTAALKQLEQQLACHWTLIRRYQICDQLHPSQPSEQLRCTLQAKINADSCLSKPASDTKPANSNKKPLTP